MFQTLVLLFQNLMSEAAFKKPIQFQIDESDKIIAAKIILIILLNTGEYSFVSLVPQMLYNKYKLDNKSVFNLSFKTQMLTFNFESILLFEFGQLRKLGDLLKSSFLENQGGN